MNAKVFNITTLREVTEMTNKYRKKPTVENAREWMKEFYDEFLCNNMSDDNIVMIYKAFLEQLENKCDKVILDVAGEKRIPVGTKVIMKHDFPNLNIKSGDVYTIEETFRFDEDTFGQGWYRYTINGCILYGYEFTLMDGSSPYVRRSLVANE